MISVLLIADDQDLVRMGLRTLLEHADGFEVAGEAADGLGAVELARELRPDVVLMDIRMPGIDGLTATGRLLADPDLAETRVLVLTTFEHDEYVFEALRSGASGFLLKNTPPAQLLEAIATVADGGALLAPSVTRTLIQEFTQLSPDLAGAAPAAGRPDRPRARGDGAGRPRPVEPGDRRAPRRQPGDRTYPRQPGDGEARRPRPGPAGGVRLPVRAGLRVRPSRAA